MIDLVRTPVDLYRAGGELVRIWPLVALAVAGVLAGTLVGERLLLGLSRERFRQIVCLVPPERLPVLPHTDPAESVNGS